MSEFGHPEQIVAILNTDVASLVVIARNTGASDNKRQCHISTKLEPACFVRTHGVRIRRHVNTSAGEEPTSDPCFLQAPPYLPKLIAGNEGFLAAFDTGCCVHANYNTVHIHEFYVRH